MISPFVSGNLPMPRWAHVPGETAEANADHETLAQAKLLVPPRFRGYQPARHPALRYGIALNDRGYFWESQEILEAVWAAAPQGERERILLRACILIASGQLRLRMQKPHAASWRRAAGAVRAQLPTGDGCRRWVRRRLSNRGVDGPAQGQARQAIAV
jgi:Domain of unknown function (DUF309)